MKKGMIISFFCLAAFLGTACNMTGVGTAGETGVKKDIAIQLYSVRSLVGKDSGNELQTLLDTLASMGYTAIEAASYNDGKLYGLPPEEFREKVEKSGMKVLSSHCNRYLSEKELASGDFSESLAWWKKCISAHKAAGMKYLVMPYLAVPKTVEELQKYCEYFNEVGKMCREEGILFGYHNHAHEFEKVEGRETMFDYMLNHTDPENVFFEMDVYWTVIGNASPVEYFSKYPGRFRILHIKDQKEIGRSGMVGFDAIFRNISTAGTENIVVEVERYSYDDVLKSIDESIEYLEDAPFVPASYTE